MPEPRSPRPGHARSSATVAAPRPSGLLALALAASTGLAALGSVPASSPEPALARVVVSVASAGADGVTAAAAAVTAAGGTVLDRLPLVDGVSALLPAGAVLAPGTTVVPDRPVSLAQSADPSAGGAPSTVRATLGLGPAHPAQGAGVTVAVVDTGVAPHPDLAGRLTSVDVSGAGSGDGHGHGTFVAGVAAGSGAGSDGRYAGVAPGSTLLDVRVADDDGSTDLVTVLRGLEAARARGADVVNLSLSSYSPLPWQVDPLTLALTRLWAEGTVVVVPAGNDGPGAGTTTSPGVAPALLTVGALDEAGTADRDDDAVASFSARGPAPQGAAKPEVVAPGRSMVSLRAEGSVVDRQHGATGLVGTAYFRGSGTSFSTAAVAGAAAVLLSERPALTPDQVKRLLTTTAYGAAGLGEVDAAGAGGVDLAAALAAPAPDAPAACVPAGKGRGASGECGTAAVPGRVGEWRPLLGALQRGNLPQAARAWERLSPEARNWAASSWSALPADLRDELTAGWTGGGDAAEWAARNWAARNWAARNWAASSWSARNWAGSSWSGEAWLFDGAGADWAARNWAARNWAARNWAASSWSARNWAGSSWSARNWAASSWSASGWAAAQWGA